MPLATGGGGLPDIVLNSHTYRPRPVPRPSGGKTLPRRGWAGRLRRGPARGALPIPLASSTSGSRIVISTRRYTVEQIVAITSGQAAELAHHARQLERTMGEKRALRS